MTVGVILAADGTPMIQASIDAALALDEVLDLDGKSWICRELLLADTIVSKNRVKIRNGRIDYRGPWSPTAETVAFQISGTPELIDFEMYKNGGLNLVGIDIYDSAGGDLDRVKLDHWRNGGCTGLRISGGQRMNVRSLLCTDNDTQMVIRKGRTQATDIKFWGCGFGESGAFDPGPAIDMADTSGVSFYGGAMETSRKGNLVLLNGCKNTTFNTVRFEGVGALSPGEYSHVHQINGTRNTLFSDNTTFNSTSAGPDGIYPPVLSDDGTSERTRTRNCVFPVGPPPLGIPSHSPGMDITDTGSDNFSGDRLEALREMLE